MFLEYNWTANCYQPRIGHTFTSINGLRSYASLDEARYELSIVGLKLGRKTDSCTWEIQLKSKRGLSRCC